MVYYDGDKCAFDEFVDYVNNVGGNSDGAPVFVDGGGAVYSETDETVKDYLERIIQEAKNFDEGFKYGIRKCKTDVDGNVDSFSMDHSIMPEFYSIYRKDVETGLEICVHDYETDELEKAVLFCEKCNANSEIAYAWKSLIIDCIIKCYEGIPFSVSGVSSTSKFFSIGSDKRSLLNVVGHLSLNMSVLDPITPERIDTLSDMIMDVCEIEVPYGY